MRDAGYDPLPDFKTPSYAKVDPEFDLILMTGIRTMALHHSRFRNHAWSRRLANAPELRLHPRGGCETRIRKRRLGLDRDPAGCGSGLPESAHYG